MTHSRRKRKRGCWAWTACADVAAIVLWALGASQAHAQATWEYTPYQVRLKIALQPVPQLPQSLVPSLGDATAARADTVLGAIWSIKTATASSKLQTQVLAGIDKLTAADIVEASSPEDLSGDKLYIAAIGQQDGAFRLAVRELDCRTQQLGPSYQQTALQLSGLSSALWEAILAGFTPLARIERVEENRVTARLRAGGLITDPASPALIDPGMVLRPIVRRNDSSGRPLPGGIHTLPWTVLAVNERRESLIECRLYSGYRSPIPVRGSARVERLGLLMRPRSPTTRLVLKVRDNPDKPLVGYEIQLKMLGDEQPRPVGKTDAAGSVELSSDSGLLQIVYVKSGSQLLARLPIVPGQEELLIAHLPDDDPRLEVEGFIATLSSRALDLVARREILAARIRARLKEGKLTEAQQLLDDFRELETRRDLDRDLQQFRQRTNASDKLTQQRIEKLFAEAQQMLLLKALSDDLLSQLTRELAAARASSPTRSANEGS